MPSFRDLSVLDRMNVSQGSYYSTFVWRFTNPLENPSFKEFALEPFDAGYMISCVIFVILGSCGIFLNGRSLYFFFRPKTVSFTLVHTYANTPKQIIYFANKCDSNDNYIIFIGEKSVQYLSLIHI